MKIVRISLLLGTFCSLLQNAVLAQGSLTPPGAPAPTMKTLQQIEPRTPISSVPYTINTPGSYYVTTNLTGGSGQIGISISANNVTLDLNGFSLFGLAGSVDGIAITSSFNNITIRNGSVSGWGNNGVDGYSFEFPRNVVYEQLTISSNASYGLLVEADSVIRDCLSYYNGVGGISSQGGLIVDCVARNNGSYGIMMITGKVRSCTSSYNWTGIYADHASVEDCDISNGTTNGVTVLSDCQIVNNRIADNHNSFYGYAINVTGSLNYIANNTILNNNFGLVATGGAVTNNIIVQNKFIGSSATAVNGNNIWPTTELPTSAGGSFTNANAWINIVYP